LEQCCAILFDQNPWGLFDRAPLLRWSAGRVTLLGDACHPMLPFMEQGAALAIEDAATLAACLGKVDDVPAALRLYEKLRLPRVSRLQATSETNKTRFHLPDGPAQQRRDAAMAGGSMDWVARRRHRALRARRGRGGRTGGTRLGGSRCQAVSR
jgi:salicylate hydroxylase